MGEGLLAAEEFLLGDDGTGGGGTTSRTSGISVVPRIWLVGEDTALQMYTSSSRTVFH